MSDTDNLIQGDSQTENATDRFLSLDALRVAHSELLKRYRESGDGPKFLGEVEDFIHRGQATGALLDVEDDRWAAQSLLDYWATMLYRYRHESPDASLAEFDPMLAPRLDNDLCPYMGLDAFNEDDQNVFFGRRRLVQDMEARLEEDRLLAVVGPSGSGKSSLVLAGLLPALKTGAVSGSQNWRYYPRMVPGSKPLENLARLLRPSGVNASEWNQERVEHFRQDADHLAQLLDDLGDGPAVLVVDQFEEMFTLCDDDVTRQAFVDNLLNLIQSPGDRHTIILTMRIDFEPRLARFPRLQPLFEKAQVSVPPLNVSELRRAIEEPAALIGLKFEEGVVNALLHDILGEPAALPLLQFTLLKLWEGRDHNRVTWAAYSRLGGGRQALAYSADKFYEKKLIPEEQVTAKRILLRMARPGEGLEVTSNRVRREELYQAGEARYRVDQVLDKLIQARLVHLTEGDMPGDVQVEVAHEALVRNWPKLVDWIEDEREMMRHRLRLTAAAEQWEALDKDSEALWRGVLLKEALRYQDLSELETEFVQASQAAVQQAEQEAEAARQRELAQARALATEKTNAARRLGRLALVLALVFLLAVWWGAAAVIQGQKAQNNADLAVVRLTQAVEAQGTAEAARGAAETAEAAAVTFAANAEISATQVAHIAAELQSLDLTEGAQYAFGGYDIDTALVLALKANSIVDTPSAQAKQMLTQVAYASATRRRFEHDAPLYSAAFSPDGRTILAGSSDGSLILWDIESGEEIRRFGGHTGEVWSVVIGPNGRTALSGAADKSLILWDIESGREIRRFEGHAGAVLGVAISPDGLTALSGSKDRSLILWDIESGEEIHRFEGHTDWVWSVAFSPDGRTALSGSEDDDLILWDIESGEEIRCFERHTDGVRAVTFSRDVATALSGSYDDTMILWDVENGTIVRTFLEEYVGTVYSVAISPDGRLALSGSEDGNLHLWDVENGKEIHRFAGHTDWVRAATFAPDGRTALSASEDGSIRLWDIEGGAEIRRFGGKEIQCPVASRLPRQIDDVVFGVAISPDGHTALLGAGDGSLILWDIESGEEIHRFKGHTAEVFGVAFSPDGDTVLSGSMDGSLILWDIESGEEIRRFEGHTAGAFGVAFSPDGDTALSGSPDDGLILWDIESGEEIRRFGEYTEVFGVAFGPGGDTALSSSLDGGLNLWDIESGEEIGRFGENTVEVFSVAFSPDGNTALAGSMDGSLILWDIESGQEICRFQEHTAEVFGVAFSPDGSTALSGSTDGSLILWDVESKGEEKTYDSVHSVAIGPDGSVALAGSKDSSLILWDIESGVEIRRLKGHTNAVNSVAFGPDGQIALSGSADNNLILWDVERGEEIRRFKGHTDAVLDVALGLDGHTALSSSADTTLISWDTESGDVIHRFEGHTDWVYCVAISPDARTALSGAADGVIILWDIESGTEIHRLEGHAEGVSSIAFSPSGDTALSGSTGGELILWDVENGKEIRRFEGYSGLVGAVAFSPDGHTALSGFADGTLTLWDVESGMALYHFRGGHTDAVNSVAFGPDGRTVLSGSDDASLILWRIHSPDELVEWTSRNRYVRELSCDEREQYRVRPFCTSTPTPTPTPMPDLTPTPTATPVSAGEATLGDNRGEVPLGGGQIWTYDGQTREILTIRVSADRPANTASQRERRERELLDTALTVYAPDGTILVEADDIERGAVTDSFVEALMLPVSGAYRIEVRGQAMTGGAYTLMLMPPQVITFGETVTGTVEIGGRHIWTFEGAAEQIITIMMSKDNSRLDSYLVLRGLDGTFLTEDDDSGGDYNSMIDHFPLPETGIYMVVASGYGESGGAYTLTLIDESQNSAD